MSLQENIMVIYRKYKIIISLKWGTHTQELCTLNNVAFEYDSCVWMFSHVLRNIYTALMS